MKTKTNKTCTKRQLRKKQTAEDFTPAWLTNQILDKLNEYSPESWIEGKTFLDPACGNGNLLIPVLKRKLSLGHTDPLSTIYGTDIMTDNIKECRLRLLKIIQDEGITITKEHIKIIMNHIVLTPLSRYKNGSLDYEFKFLNKAKIKDIDRWYDGITNNTWLDLVGHHNINAIIRNEVQPLIYKEKMSFLTKRKR